MAIAETSAGAMPAIRPATGGVLALDLASVVGWAYGLLTQKQPIFGTWHLPHIGGEGGRFAAFENELEAALERWQPAHMVLEKSFSLQAFAQSSSYRIMAQQISLRGFAYAEGWRTSTSISEIDAYTVRTEVLGQGRFAKDKVKREVVRWCMQHGMRVPDHNAGDAVLVWEWHRRRIMGVGPVAGPLFREDIAWRQ